MRAAWLLVLSIWSAAGAAQTMYKCSDAQRRITYSNETCEKQGLIDVGPVADRVTSMPFTQPSKPAARKDAAKAPDGADTGRASAPLKPVVPQLEKLLK